ISSIAVPGLLYPRSLIPRKNASANTSPRLCLPSRSFLATYSFCFVNSSTSSACLLVVLLFIFISSLRRAHFSCPAVFGCFGLLGDASHIVIKLIDGEKLPKVCQFNTRTRNCRCSTF